MNYAVLFPGQGAQFVGMGAGLFEAAPDLLVEQGPIAVIALLGKFRERIIEEVLAVNPGKTRAGLESAAARFADRYGLEIREAK